MAVKANSYQFEARNWVDQIGLETTEHENENGPTRERDKEESGEPLASRLRHFVYTLIASKKGEYKTNGLSLSPCSLAHDLKLLAAKTAE